MVAAGVEEVVVGVDTKAAVRREGQPRTGGKEEEGGRE